MAKTGIVRDVRYLDHQANTYHPESHHRLEVIHQMLQEPGMKGKFVEIPPRLATREELELIHVPRYVQLVASTADRDYAMLDPDTYACPKSYETARLAAGGVLAAVDQVMSGTVDNAFAFIRPPGHHAESSRAMGFCLFNNVAVAAAYALPETQDPKGPDHRLGPASWQRHPAFLLRTAGGPLFFHPPVSLLSGDRLCERSGERQRERLYGQRPAGAGPGRCGVHDIFEEILEPISLEYKPDLVFVSAGFDIYYQDPLGGMQVTPPALPISPRSSWSLRRRPAGGRSFSCWKAGITWTACAIRRGRF